MLSDHETNRIDKNAGIVPVVMLVLFVLTGMASADTIKVKWDPERVCRGAVVPLYVKSPLVLQASEVKVKGERFPLIRLEDSNYVALIGVDLNEVEPTLPVDFTLYMAKGGPPFRIRADLKVRESETAFNEQQLSFPSGMVDFSQKRLNQIRQDSETLWDALGTRVHRRFWREGFVMPVSGRITTRFGTRRILNGKPRSPHNGVDIAALKGTPILASNAGKIALVDSFYLSGQTVVVDHGWGLSTIYAHMESIEVLEGQEVKRGQPIGTVGSTGRATGPHLHFGALIRGVKVDPLQLIEATRDFNKP